MNPTPSLGNANMSPFGRALDLVAHDKTVHQYLRDVYWSRASKTQKQRLDKEEKAVLGYAILTAEQKALVGSVSHIWNRHQRQR